MGNSREINGQCWKMHVFSFFSVFLLQHMSLIILRRILRQYFNKPNKEKDELLSAFARILREMKKNIYIMIWPARGNDIFTLHAHAYTTHICPIAQQTAFHRIALSSIWKKKKRIMDLSMMSTWFRSHLVCASKIKSILWMLSMCCIEHVGLCGRYIMYVNKTIPILPLINRYFLLLCFVCLSIFSTPANKFFLPFFNHAMAIYRHHFLRPTII